MHEKESKEENYEYIFKIKFMCKGYTQVEN